MTPPSSVPAPWASSAGARARFFRSVGRSERPLLICDYDGTLAPFQEDKMQAWPYPGVAERLRRIAAGRTGLAFVSGRPASELIELFPLAGDREIWGMHGREHRLADGQYRRIEPTDAQRRALDQAQSALEAAGWGPPMVERKTGSLALHWRTFQDQPAALQQAREAAEAAFAPHTGGNSLALLPFDGGLELRAEDHTKAHAVRALLAGSQPNAAAFLGDDITDEDAFQAIREHGGLPLLVRPESRPSYAAYAIRPPGDLLAFLDDWLAAAVRVGNDPVL